MNDAAAQQRLLPRTCALGRRHRSTRAALSSASWTAPATTIPPRCRGLSFSQRLAFTDGAPTPTPTPNPTSTPTPTPTLTLTPTPTLTLTPTPTLTST